MIWDPCLARAVAAELGERLGGGRARAIRLRREARVVVVYFRDATLEVDLGPGRGVMVVGPATEPDGEGRSASGGSGGGRGRAGRARDRDEVPARAGAEAAPGADRGTRDQPLERDRRRGYGSAGAQALAGSCAHVPCRLVSRGPRRDRRATVRRASRWMWRDGMAWWTEPTVAKPARRCCGGSSTCRGSTLDAFSTRRLPKRGLCDGGPWPKWRTCRRTSCTCRRGSSRIRGPLPGTRAEPVGSLLDAMEAVRADAAPDATARHGLVARHLADRRRRLRRKLGHLRRQLEGTAAAAELRAEGSLVLSSLHLIERGAARVSLTDFDGTERTIAIDPQVRPQEHANALFRRAARLERAAEELPEPDSRRRGVARACGRAACAPQVP